MLLLRDLTPRFLPARHKALILSFRDDQVNFAEVVGPVSRSCIADDRALPYRADLFARARVERTITGSTNESEDC